MGRATAVEAGARAGGRGGRLLWAAWSALVAGLAGGAALWAAAVDHVGKTGRIVGYGSREYHYTVTTVDGVVLGLGVAVAVAGVATWLGLLVVARRRRRSA